MALATLTGPRLVVRDRPLVAAFLCLLERLAHFEHLDEEPLGERSLIVPGIGLQKIQQGTPARLRILEDALGIVQAGNLVSRIVRPPAPIRMETGGFPKPCALDRIRIQTESGLQSKGLKRVLSHERSYPAGRGEQFLLTSPPLAWRMEASNAPVGLSGGCCLSKHIGIVAASPEGSAFCYRLIGKRVSEFADPSRRPTVTLHNRPFSTYIEALDQQDWQTIGHMLAESAHTLATAGADFCILPDNALHHALPLAEPESPIPWLSMIDLVATAVETQGCATLGLIGTKIVSNGSTYQTALGLRGMHLLVPEDNDVDAIDTIIFKEAVFGRVRNESRQRVIHTVGGLASRGCEALILGCSEASWIITPEESPIPVFDPVELLAEAAVRHATQPSAV